MTRLSETIMRRVDRPLFGLSSLSVSLPHLGSAVAAVLGLAEGDRLGDDEGEVLDFLVQPRRCAKSARRLLRNLSIF